MTRLEYMKELELLLSDIPADEREDAINYYNDYFDASEQSEEDTIASLGTPEELAKTIKLANGTTTVIDGEYSETGYYANDAKASEVVPYTAVGTPVEKPKKSVGTIILITILAICAAPILLPISIAAFAFIFAFGIAVIATLFALFVTVIACGLGALVGGFIALITGITSLFSNTFGALVVIGFAMIAFAVGIVFLIALSSCVGSLFKQVITWVGSVIKVPFTWIKSKISKKEGELSE